jgi:hypothetical protein
MGGSPAWELGVGLTTVQHKMLCSETFTKALELDGFFGTTWTKFEGYVNTYLSCRCLVLAGFRE